MTFLSVLIVLILIQVWGSGAPLHHDGWFIRWLDWLSVNASLRKLQAKLQPARKKLGLPEHTMRLVIALSLPVGVMAYVMHWLSLHSSFLFLIASVIVLLYCMGRGVFSSAVQSYMVAVANQDWVAATQMASRLEADIEDIDMNDWTSLHQAILKSAGYRGFERMFAVLFWFVLLGPAGAFLYRLSAINANRSQWEGAEEVALTERWLWLLEWPAVRFFGLTLALTGNFVGCVQQSRNLMACPDSSTQTVLMDIVRGALMTGESVSEDVLSNEVRALQSLFSRTLLLWVCLLAIISLIF